MTNCRSLALKRSSEDIEFASTSFPGALHARAAHGICNSGRVTRITRKHELMDANRSARLTDPKGAVMQLAKANPTKDEGLN